MRQADLNRVNKAKEHFKAAVTILNNIKWENINSLESDFLKKSKEWAGVADSYLDDIINIQNRIEK